MRSKLLILSLFVSLLSAAQKLPVNGLCWSDIKAKVGGTCLDQAFSNANPAYFDATFAESGNCLMEFRNYGEPPCTRPSGMTNTGLYYDCGGVFIGQSNVCYYSNAGACSYGMSAQGLLTEGSDIYFNVYSTDCEKIGDGYYVLQTGNGPRYAVNVSGGKLYYISCNTAPTAFTSESYAATCTTLTITYNEIIKDGGSTVTSRGLAYGTSANPTTSGTITTDGSGVGSFNSELTGLSPSTTYHVRAYGVNSTGTGYGADMTFATEPPCSSPPTVSTSNAYFIETSTAFLEGTVNSDNGATVTSRGFCWSTTNSDPTTSDSAHSVGSGTGYFSWTAYVFPESTTIFIRAYATNSQGTSYGEVITANSDYQQQ